MDKQDKKLHAGPPHYTLPGHSNGKQGGQEEHGARRKPTTSVVARTGK